jgi:hypothetical protein
VASTWALSHPPTPATPGRSVSPCARSIRTFSPSFLFIQGWPDWPQTCEPSHPPLPRCAETRRDPEEYRLVNIPSKLAVLFPWKADGCRTVTCDGCSTLSVRSPEAMARRNVRSSVRIKSRTEQVCGAKHRKGAAVLLIAEQEATIRLPYAFREHKRLTGCPASFPHRAGCDSWAGRRLDPKQ